VAGPRSRFVALLLAGLTLALAVGILVSVARAKPLPVLATLPPFSLRAASGESVSLEGLRGRVWVADFIFTRCVGSCPVMTAKMREVQGLAPPGTRLVSFTVDPGFDTPEVLARYAARAGAKKDWVFVTGAKEALYALSTGGFKLAALEVPKDDPSYAEGPFLHSSRLVLVDGRGRIRGYYDTEVPGVVDKLLTDLGALARHPG
jgi:protein SCO1/2